ncbi:MAG: hypothetical protein EBQ92_00330 [Proteobacteria bacterium]|nr:hypothetical protein [Pseudomonadota bacterium]
MAMKFVQDYGNNLPNWAYYYKDSQNYGHLEFGGNGNAQKFQDFLVQTSVSPYVQLYLYSNGLNVKPQDGSNFNFNLYYSSSYVNLNIGREVSHFANIYSDGLSSKFMTTNTNASFVTALGSSLYNAALDIYTQNYAVFAEATLNESYIGVQNANGSALIYLDTANIPATAGNKEIVLREIEICSDGVKKKMLILASQPYSF